MATLIWIVIGMVLSLGSLWVIRYRHRLVADVWRGSMATVLRRSKKNSVQEKIPSIAHTHKCVTVRPCLEACAVASKQQGRRYLSADAPDLPLPGCDSDECACRYRYHNDRRDNEDRRFRLSRFNEPELKLGGKEKRSGDKDDRRKSEQEAEPPAYFNNY